MIESILKWLAITTIAWPIFIVFWEYLVIPSIKRWVINVGKEGFSPLIINMASSSLWLASAIILLNVFAFWASFEPEGADILGIPVNVISDTIPLYYAIPLIVLAFELNALAAKWSKTK